MSRYLKGLSIDGKAFRKELDLTRERGYAISRNELIEGAVAVAAPFHTPKGVAGSLGVFGPATRLGDNKIVEVANLLMAEANQLSRALGVQA